MGPLLAFYRYFICLAVIPASYVGHKFMSDSLQVPVITHHDPSNFSFYSVGPVPGFWNTSDQRLKMFFGIAFIMGLYKDYNRIIYLRNQQEWNT